MRDKENPCFETLEKPLTRIKEPENKPNGNATGAGVGKEANSDAPENEVGVGVTRRREVEIEIRCDIPTGAEIKAVENFFDWLLAEALRLTGEIGKAA